MQITDTIADMLTRIRNASSARHETVVIIPASNMKKSIAQILVDEGFVKSFQVVEDGKQGVIRMTLKYVDGKTPVITGLRRVSKPGLRIYSNCEDMPKVMKGLGIAIVSTSKGVMTDKRARKENVAAKSLHLYGKEVNTNCPVSVRNPLLFPPALKLKSTAAISLLKAPREPLRKIFVPN